jgi:SAM-dependent methyltransferase
MSVRNKADIDELMAAIRAELTAEARRLEVSQPDRAPQSLSIDEIMSRVRGEVARRRNGQAGSVASLTPPTPPSCDLSIRRWEPAAPQLPVKRRYTLSELVGFPDADFIDVAYRTVLRRPPDENGLGHYLHLLRTGAASKVEILEMLCKSTEGKSHGVQVDGLFLPYLVQKWRRKRFIGPLIGWAHTFLRLGSLSERQAMLDIVQARESQALGRLLNEVSDQLVHRITTFDATLATRAAASSFEALKREHAATVSRLAELKANVARDLAGRPDGAAFAALKDQHAATVVRLGEVNSSIRAGLRTHEERQERFESRIESVAVSLQELLARERDMLARHRQAIDEIRALDPLYAAFEDRFRGDPALIRARVEPYLELVREAEAGTAIAPVVDVGCGRGEWLEVLRDQGFVAWGIEINRAFIRRCRDRDLKVTEGDALETLRALPESSLGAITFLHIVEHLPFERVIALLDEARRVLRPRGLIVVETPNPENLSVAHHLFYMDPTHRNPLPPEALRWIVEARGFPDARINRLTAARELNAPPVLPDNAPGAASINVLLHALNVPADYAIVARRASCE